MRISQSLYWACAVLVASHLSCRRDEPEARDDTEGSKTVANSRSEAERPSVVDGHTDPVGAKIVTSSERGSEQESVSHESGDAANRGAEAYGIGMCAKCHRENGKGGPRAPDLTDDDWIHCDGSITGIRNVLVSGVPKEKLKDQDRPFQMNPATNLIHDEALIDALASYVHSLGRP